MPSNFSNEIRQKQKTRAELQSDYEAFLAAGRQVIKGDPCIPVPRKPAEVMPKKLTLKELAKKHKVRFYGQD